MSINPLRNSPEVTPMHQELTGSVTQPFSLYTQEQSSENRRTSSQPAQPSQGELVRCKIEQDSLMAHKYLTDIETFLAKIGQTKDDDSATQHIGIQKEALRLYGNIPFLRNHLKKISNLNLKEEVKEELIELESNRQTQAEWTRRAEEYSIPPSPRKLKRLPYTTQTISQDEASLNRAVQCSSLEDVKALVKAACLPSPLTYHLARAHNNTEAINILDEVSIFLPENHVGFTREEFHIFIKNLEKIEALNLSGHPEITDDYFDIPKEEPILVFSSLRKLNLQNCSAITDAGIKQILHCFPYLEEINLDTSRVYEDIEFLIQDEANTPVSPEYEAYKKRQSKITKEGIAHLAHCTHLRVLSLRYCHHVTDDIVEIFQHPNNFPRLQELDLSDCYRIAEDTLQKIAHSKNNLRIIKDRVMSPSVLHLLASLEKQDQGPIDKQVLPVLYQAVAEDNDKLCLSLLIDSNEYPPEQQECSYQERSIEDILHLAAQKSDFLIFYALLRRLGLPTTESLLNLLNLAISQNGCTEVIRMILDCAVSPTEESFQIALCKRKSSQITHLLLEHVISPPPNILALAIKHQYNNLFLIRSFFQKTSRPSENLLSLAIQYNHFRVVRFLLKKDFAPTEESLNLAVRYNSLSTIKIILNENIHPTKEALSLLEEANHFRSLSIHFSPSSANEENPCDCVQPSHSYQTLDDTRKFLEEESEISSILEKENHSILRGTFSEIDTLLTDSSFCKSTIKQRMLNLALQRCSFTVVSKVLEKNPEPSDLTYQIAYFGRSWKILKMLQEKYENFPKACPITKEFLSQLKQFWKENLIGIRRLDLSRSEEMGEALTYSVAGEFNPLAKLRQLGLSCCEWVDDNALKQIAIAFPELEILAIGAYRQPYDDRFRDLEKKGVDLSSLSLAESKQYEDYRKRKSKITTHGIRHLTTCSSLTTLFLTSCTNLTDDIAQVLGNPTYFPRLRYLDIRNCIFTTETVQAIRFAHPKSILTY